MSRKVGAALAALVVVALALPLTARADEPIPTPSTTGCQQGVLCVGYGEADATWHVGAGAGQYAGENDGSAVTGGDADPSFHATKSENSYGVASRLSMRAIVLEGANGGPR